MPSAIFSLVSILCLRCPTTSLPPHVSLTTCFNSLFEMHQAGQWQRYGYVQDFCFNSLFEMPSPSWPCRRRLTQQFVSILCLRCRIFSIAISGSVKPSFNSLFEMPVARDYVNRLWVQIQVSILCLRCACGARRGCPRHRPRVSILCLRCELYSLLELVGHID